MRVYRIGSHQSTSLLTDRPLAASMNALVYEPLRTIFHPTTRDETYVFDLGSVVAHGSGTDLLGDARVRSAYLGV